MGSCTKFVINPFTGKIDAYRDTVSSSQNVTDTRQCATSVSTGDLVMESSTLVDTVDTVTDNTDLRPVFAIVISKESATECTILLLGEVAGFTGLTKGRKVFLDTSGSITATPVTTGYLQCLGVAKEFGIVDFRPQMDRIKRI